MAMSSTPKLFIFSMQDIELDFLANNPDVFAGIDVKSTPRRLTSDSVALAAKSNAVCAFVNDVLDKDVLSTLCSYSIKVLLMRCAGYNVSLPVLGSGNAGLLSGMLVARVISLDPRWNSDRVPYLHKYL